MLTALQLVNTVLWTYNYAGEYRRGIDLAMRLLGKVCSSHCCSGPPTVEQSDLPQSMHCSPLALVLWFALSGSTVGERRSALCVRNFIQHDTHIAVHLCSCGGRSGPVPRYSRRNVAVHL